MKQPVRKLAFKGKERLYKMDLDLDLEREKAIEVSRILDEEDDVKIKMERARKNIVSIKASGNVSPKAMRCIIQVLAV